MASTPLSGLRGLTHISETNAHTDPNVVYNRLRAQWGEVAPIELEPGINAWLVMGHQELVQVLRNEKLFAKDASHWQVYIEGRVRPNSPLAPFMTPRPNVWQTDGSEHRRLRAPLDDAVNSINLRRATNQVREICNSLIDVFAEKGQGDLVLEYALLIPALVVGRLLGLDLETAQTMHQTLMEMFALDEGTQAANDRFEKILMNLVQERKAEPADDMASVIVQHSNFREDVEMMHSLVMLVAASSECQMAWIGGTLQMMLTDARFAGRMRGGRLGVDDALDEVLWRDPPVANLPGRYARADTELGGQFIQRGDALILAFGASSADPRVHTDDPWSEIGNRAHLSWSAGPHMCPAQVPARLIVREAVEAALYRLPGLKLTVSPSEIPRMPSPWGRCPFSLPVSFIPAKTKAEDGTTADAAG